MAGMRMPDRPPAWQEILHGTELSNRFTEILSAVSAQPASRGSYLHWDKLRHLPPPGGISHREWWLVLKLQRLPQRKNVPLKDVNGGPFVFGWADPIPEQIHEVDLRAGGSIGIEEPITNPETKDRYLIRSLVEEALTSSQLEGAATTRRVAKEMIRSGRKPRDQSEQMILNNYLTMQRIGKLKAEPLTKDLILELHRVVTRKTLDDSEDSGQLRRRHQKIDIGDDYGQVFHNPPPAEQLEERRAAMCDFANAKTPGEFVHPVIRAIILHFWLAYDHPFIDGNGRTARALFYWSMLHAKYWLCEFISISEIIRKAPAKYGRAFLHTETDDNDLTYFILYHLEVIRQAIDQLHAYLRRETEKLQELEGDLRTVAVLNHRQRALVSHALRHPRYLYTIESHQNSHNVVYQTARTDLLDLRDRGILEGRKVGRGWQFTPAPDIEDKLRTL